MYQRHGGAPLMPCIIAFCTTVVSIHFTTQKFGSKPCLSRYQY